MRLSHNMLSINIYRQYSKHLLNQSTALNRISSGLKVATAKDDPNKMAQSEQLKLQIRGIQMAAKNTQDAVSMIQAADGSANNISEIIIRIKELITSAGGSHIEESLQSIQGEINQMIEGIDNIAKFAEFNGVRLLAEEGSDVKNPETLELLSGGNVGDITKIPKYDLTAKGLGLIDNGGKVTIDVKDVGGSIDKINKSLDITSIARSKYGAITNRLDSTFSILNESSQEIEGAEAEITGADISLEIIEYSKHSLLIESSLALMIQTNKMPQDILTVLQNVRGR
ncbi:flagellin N-terminal helical domain-containing protein [Clostridium faecium]|uniref:Flagellin n=1 Tax=Clostridium faecium TaxID=2762223 RepID=A0ABR8YQA0_9CLOT|nr:flagellin [Clostridium faecium]MBD8046426.1 flagellin [Clostridium faecium]